jgi:serine/threonine-protein kinase
LAYAALALAVAGLGAYLAVSLVVERAAEVAVPEIEGLSLSEALDELNAEGLDLEVRAFVYSDRVRENRIVRQKPVPGRIVKAGRGVGVVLSRGPERHPVPDVRGLNVEDARILFEEAQLKVDVRAKIRWGPEGEVVAQGVEPGRRLPAGSVAPLIVSLGRKPSSLRMPRLEGMTLDHALAELDASELRAGRVEEVSLEDPSRHGRVVSQEPLPGFPVARGEGVIISVAASSRPVTISRGVLISRTLPPGFARHRIEVLVDRDNGPWTVADEWVGGGATFRLWVQVRPGEMVRMRLDGEDEPWGTFSERGSTLVEQ